MKKDSWKICKAVGKHFGRLTIGLEMNKLKDFTTCTIFQKSFLFPRGLVDLLW